MLWYLRCLKNFKKYLIISCLLMPPYCWLNYTIVVFLCNIFMKNFYTIAWKKQFPSPGVLFLKAKWQFFSLESKIFRSWSRDWSETKFSGISRDSWKSEFWEIEGLMSSSEAQGIEFSSVTVIFSLEICKKIKKYLSAART